jgi:hypothetical protein
MRYGITRLVLGCSQWVDLTPGEYEEAKTARARLFVVLGIEEKLNLVLENYAEFEQELQTLTLRHILFHDDDWSSVIGELQTINRRLTNFLSACRLYVDQIKHDFNELYIGQARPRDQLTGAFSAEYDGCFGYRVLEALRNHVQHRSLPIHRLQYPSAGVEGRHGRIIRNTCVPSLSVRRIAALGDFKTIVLKELKAGDDLVDLKPLVREYVASLGRVHQGLRERMKNDVDTWEQVITSIQARFREAYGTRLLGLAVVSKSDDGAVHESASIFDDVVKRRKQLERKNRHVAHVRSHYVSGEVLGDAVSH